MQRSAHMLSLITAMVLFGLLMSACGSNDVLDETYDRYVLDMSITDGEVDDTHDVDVRQSIDCDGDGDPEDSEEGVFQAIGVLTITVASDAAGLTLDRYRVEYIPQPSPNDSGGTTMPPTLTPISQNLTSLYVGPGESTIETVIAMTTTTKRYFDTSWYITSDVDEALYTIKVTLYCTDNGGNEKELYFYKDVALAEWLRCG